MAIRVAVSGACGRMGSGIIRTLREQRDMQLVAAIEAKGNPNAGKDVGEVLGFGKAGITLSASDELDTILKQRMPRVLIDFTNANAAMETIKVAAKNKVNLVVGTTGFSKEQLQQIGEIVEKEKISAVVSPNMATGVNVFFKIAQEIARSLGREYDVEIIEAHHRFKKDAPSGTALRAGELIAQAMGKELERSAVYGRGKGVKERGSEIAFHAVRAGDIVGEHTVLFAGDGERIELVHRATSRQAFINGAIKAARFVSGRTDGRVYTMWDVLGIK